MATETKASTSCERPFDSYVIPAADKRAALFADWRSFLSGEFTNTEQVNASYVFKLQQKLLTLTGRYTVAKVNTSDPATFSYLFTANSKAIIYIHKLVSSNSAYGVTPPSVAEDLTANLTRIYQHCVQKKIIPDEIRSTHIRHVNGNHWISIGIALTAPSSKKKIPTSFDEFKALYVGIVLYEMDSLHPGQNPPSRHADQEKIQSLFRQPVVSKPANIAQQLGNTCGFQAATNATIFGLEGMPTNAFPSNDQSSSFLQIMLAVDQKVLSQDSDQDFSKENEKQIQKLAQAEKRRVTDINLTPAGRTAYQTYIAALVDRFGVVAKNDPIKQQQYKLMREEYHDYVTNNKFSYSADCKKFLGDLKADSQKPVWGGAIFVDVDPKQVISGAALHALTAATSTAPTVSTPAAPPTDITASISTGETKKVTTRTPESTTVAIPTKASPVAMTTHAVNPSAASANSTPSPLEKFADKLRRFFKLSTNMTIERDQSFFASRTKFLFKFPPREIPAKNSAFFKKLKDIGFQGEFNAEKGFIIVFQNELSNNEPLLDLLLQQQLPLGPHQPPQNHP